MWVAHKVQCEWSSSCNVGWRPPRMWVETNPNVVGDHAHDFVYYFVNHMAFGFNKFFPKILYCYRNSQNQFSLYEGSPNSTSFPSPNCDQTHHPSLCLTQNTRVSSFCIGQS